MNILLTGVNGFIGRFLYLELVQRKYSVLCAIRKKEPGLRDPGHFFDRFFYFDVKNAKTDFKTALHNIDVVIHLAARAHMLTKSDYYMQKEFMDINFHFTKNIAELSAKMGVKRFVFISTIGVNGKSTEGICTYTEKDKEKPYNSYTISKFYAEQILRKIEAETGMEVVIIRPSLVYGPEVKANFLKLLKIVNTGIPLPFAGLNNKRSFVAIDNLVDAIAECAVHKKAGGETFLISDGHPLSTTQLLQKISAALGKKLRLFYFPPIILKMVLTSLGKKPIYDRLWGSLAVDSTKIRQHLDWQPKITFDQGIKKTTKWYLEEKERDLSLK
jgi:nucleoside-diphosphate-sugar epimerase